MDKKKVQTTRAPQAIGVYSQAIESNGFVFISGQIPLTPEGDINNASFADEVEQVIKNLSAICQEAGGTLNDIVKMTVLLDQMSDFAELNTILEGCFSQPYPARAAYEVSALPKGARVEIEAIMVRK